MSQERIAVYVLLLSVKGNCISWFKNDITFIFVKHQITYLGTNYIIYFLL